MVAKGLWRWSWWWDYEVVGRGVLGVDRLTIATHLHLFETSCPNRCPVLSLSLCLTLSLFGLLAHSLSLVNAFPSRQKDACYCELPPSAGRLHRSLKPRGTGKAARLRGGRWAIICLWLTASGLRRCGLWYAKAAAACEQHHAAMSLQWVQWRAGRCCTEERSILTRACSDGLQRPVSCAAKEHQVGWRGWTVRAF